MAKHMTARDFSTCIFFPDSLDSVIAEAEIQTSERTPLEKARRGIEFLDARITEFNARKCADGIGMVNAFSVTIPVAGGTYLTNQTAICLGAIGTPNTPSVEKGHRYVIYFLVDVFGVMQIRQCCTTTEAIEKLVKIHSMQLGMTTCSVPENITVPGAWRDAFGESSIGGNDQ